MSAIDEYQARARKLLDTCELAEYEREKFESMIEQIEERQFLTGKQKAWIDDAAKKYGVFDLRTAREIPRGDAVELPDVLKNLPKKPPRKVSQ